MANDRSDRIRELARELDEAIERRDMEALLGSFTEDCEVAFFGIKLSGRGALERGFQSIYDKLDDIRFEPVTIMTNGDTFFEEFRLNASSSRGESVSIDAAEVLIYRGDKVSNMRLYLDRLQLAGVIADGVLERKLLEAIERKSRAELE